jgi:NAD(P)H-flavin reductase
MYIVDSFTSTHTSKGSFKYSFLSDSDSIGTALKSTIGLYIGQYLPLIVIGFVSIVSLFIQMTYPRLKIWLSRYIIGGRIRIGEFIFWTLWFVSWIAGYIILILLKETMPLHSGHFVGINFGFALVPITRTSLLVKFFNLPFERAVYFHIVFGFCIITNAALHLYYVLDKYGASMIGSTSFREEVIPIAGFIGFVCILLMAIIANVRRRNWEVFYYIHVTLAVLVIVAVCVHARYVLFCLIPSLVLYALDLLNRFMQASEEAKVLDVAVNDKVVSLVVKTRGKNFLDFEAGSYAFIQIKEIDSVYHPFTIASPPGRKGQLEFHIKSEGEGSWTGRLLDLTKSVAKELKPLIADRELEENRGRSEAPNKINISLFGPFGSCSVDLSSVSCIAMIAGGIGITPFLSIYADLKAKKESGGKYPLLEQVTLIWITRGNLELTKDAVTCKAGETAFQVLTFDTSKDKRPSMKMIFREQLSTKRFAGKHTAVLACGPEVLVDAVAMEAYNRKFLFHKETFLL